jgi:erythrin-vacuolar iron transport family protein
VKRFADLSEQEVLALAINNEEEDNRAYLGIAAGLRENYPDSAKIFEEMAAEEARHRSLLFDLYRKRLGNAVLLLRRDDVRRFIKTSRSGWFAR